LTKKLLHIIDFFDIGGAEKLVLTVINELGSRLNQHLIILGEPATLTAHIQAPCKTTILDFKSYRDIWATKKFIKEYIKEHRIDIVHSQLYWSNILSRMAAGRNVKIFNTIQAVSSEASYKINRTTLYLEKITYKKRHHIIGVSKEVLKDFDQWVGLKGPSSVLYNIIDDKFFASGPKSFFSETGLKLVAVGNLRWQKNYPYLIEAFKKLPADISLDIYGEGSLRKALQQDIDKYSLNIKLCGHHEKLYTLLGQYDAFVMCSLYEGFSLGLMEAMATGLPVVISDVPVLKEAGGDAAVYVDLSNPESFAEAVIDLKKNKNKLRTYAAAAHARAKSLADKKMFLTQLLKLYEIPEQEINKPHKAPVS
jgi:glycosyltransferase involved in cell wall biosynthesis